MAVLTIYIYIIYKVKTAVYISGTAVLTLAMIYIIIYVPCNAINTLLHMSKWLYQIAFERSYPADLCQGLFQQLTETASSASLQPLAKEPAWYLQKTAHSRQQTNTQTHRWKQKQTHYRNGWSM